MTTFRRAKASDLSDIVAMLADDTFVEVQGTGEHATFSTRQLDEMLALATQAIRELHTLQRAALR